MGPGKPFIYTLFLILTLPFFLVTLPIFDLITLTFMVGTKQKIYLSLKKLSMTQKYTFVKKKVNLEVKRSVIMHFNYFLNYKILLMPNKLGLLSLHNTRHTLIFLLQNSKTIQLQMYNLSIKSLTKAVLNSANPLKLIYILSVNLLSYIYYL